MIFTVTQRIEALESKKAELQVDLASGGEYINDGYGCVTWDCYDLVVIQNEINEIDSLLGLLYQHETFLIKS
jgi:hypothetical protein